MQLAGRAAAARLTQAPDDGAAHALLAWIAIDYGAPAKALEHADRALALGIREVRTDLVRGRALLAVGRQHEARALALDLASTPPEDALDCDTLGVLLVRTGAHDRALPLLQHATKLDPRRAQFMYNLATTLQFLGELEAAAEAFERVLALDADFDRARLALAELRPAAPAALVALAERFRLLAANPRDALLVGHAAAKLAERLGQHDAAIDWLDRAKAGAAAQRRYDPAATEALFRAALDAIARSEVESTGPPEARTSAPVFIIGMPRSGTTLTDRICSSHPAVVSAGELAELSLLVKRMSGTAGRHVLDPETLRAPIDSTTLGGAYRARIAPLSGGAAMLVDKMPFNAFYVPQLLAALPEARVILVRRSPLDTIFANYRQLFATSFAYYDYALGLESTAHWMAWFDVLADDLHARFAGPRLMQVAYEDLVRDQEAESRRLIAFLGLEWDEAVLRFHANPAPVATASSVQVRSPIHRRSVGRWRRYPVHAERARATYDAARATAVANRPPMGAPIVR